LPVVDVVTLDRAGVDGELRDLGRARAWLDARQTVLARRLDDLSVAAGRSFDPAVDVAAATRSSKSQANRDVRRANALDAFPELADKFGQGEVTAGQVDVVADTLSRLSRTDRALLVDKDAMLAQRAATSTPEAFEKTVKRTVAALQRDDVEAVFARQRRSNQLRTWVDQTTGMVNVRGELDPEAGGKLISRLDATVEALFHDRVPDDCPADGPARQAFLRAMALLALVDGTAPASSGRADFTVVIDRDQISVEPDVDVPDETVRRWWCDADITHVTVHGGVVTDVGRTHRLATPAQRRALRVMYPTCAMPGCDVVFARCQVHHIDEWTADHGATDLAVLAPLCCGCHRRVHEGGWTLTIDPTTRELTVRQPDGQIETTGPPRTRAG